MKSTTQLWKPSKAHFVDFPEWSLNHHGAHADASDLLSAIHLAGMADKWVRIPAKIQRRCLGFPVFGKCAVRVRSDRGDGFEVVKTVCFGTDQSGTDLTCREIDERAEKKITAL